MQSGSRSLSCRPCNKWFAAPRIVFLSAFLFVRDHSLPFWLVRNVLIQFQGRNPEYLKLNMTFAVNVLKSGFIIGLFPKPLKPCVVSIFIPLSLLLRHTLALWHACCRTSIPRFNKRWSLSDLWSRNASQKWTNLEMSGISRFVTLSHLYFSHYTAESQNDLLMWLMSEAKGVERSLEGLTRRLLTVNFAAIHTTSQASDNTLLSTTQC
jgi:hypothetical protein